MQAKQRWLLAVEDPQEPGRDICSASHNIRSVAEAFRAAAKQLKAALRAESASQKPRDEGAQQVRSGNLGVPSSALPTLKHRRCQGV